VSEWESPQQRDGAVVVAGVGGGGAAVGAAPAPGRCPRRRFLLRWHPLRPLRLPRARTAPFAPPIARFLQVQRCLPSSPFERLAPFRSAGGSHFQSTSGLLRKKKAAHGHCCSRFLASCCNLCSVFRLIVTGFVLYAPALFDCDLGIALCQQQRLGRSEDQYVKIVYIANFSSRSWCLQADAISEICSVLFLIAAMYADTRMFIYRSILLACGIHMNDIFIIYPCQCG
jgi:hypothetical protein